MKYRWILLGVVVLAGFKFFLLKTLAYHIFLRFLIPGYTSYMDADKLKNEINQQEVVILDTRAWEEYEVSHIKNAMWVGYETFDLSRLEDLPEDTSIVVYCAVGYRSDEVGKKLKEAGFTQVKNLYGGIFEWVNQGYPVYENGKKTDNIHPYSDEWGFWLSKGRKTYADS